MYGRVRECVCPSRFKCTPRVLVQGVAVTDLACSLRRHHHPPPSIPPPLPPPSHSLSIDVAVFGRCIFSMLTSVHGLTATMSHEEWGSASSECFIHTHTHTHTHRESASLIIYNKYFHSLNYSLSTSTETSVNFSTHV